MSATSNDDAKRQMITMRVTQPMRDQIARAAAATGRSLSQEIEMRLELSFQEDRRAGSAVQANFNRWLSKLLNAASAGGALPWHDDLEAWALAKSSVNLLFDHFRPTASTGSLSDLSPEGRRIVADWEAEASKIAQQQYDHGREFTELFVKKERGELSEGEAERLNSLAANPPPKARQPDLSPKDLKIFETYGRRRQLLKRATDLVAATIAALRASREVEDGA